MRFEDLATKEDIKQLLARFKTLEEKLSRHTPQKLAYDKMEACRILNVSPSKFDELVRKGKISGGNYDDSANGKKLYSAQKIHELVVSSLH